MKNAGLSALIAILIILVLGWVVAGQGENLDALHPVSIQVKHQESMVIVMTTTATSGEVLTVTKPITIDVDLRINITAPGLVDVESFDSTELITDTVNAVDVEDIGTVEMSSLLWSVVSAQAVGDTYDEDDNFRAIEAGNGVLYLLTLSFENTSLYPIEVIVGNFADSIGEVRLVDEMGRRFAPTSGVFNSECGYRVIAQPGLPVECNILFEVPNTDSDFILALIDPDDNEVGTLSIP